jgi:WD40 repeat protein
MEVVHGTITKSYTGHSGCINGVRTFSCSAFGKYVVSAADRNLLFWDIFTLENVYKIEGLVAPVVTVEVQDSTNKLFVALSNKTILVLHNITFELLQTIVDPTEHKMVDCLTSMAFAPDLSMLFTAGSRLVSWTLERYARRFLCLLMCVCVCVCVCVYFFIFIKICFNVQICSSVSTFHLSLCTYISAC